MSPVGARRSDTDGPVVRPTAPMFTARRTGARGIWPLIGGEAVARRCQDPAERIRAVAERPQGPDGVLGQPRAHDQRPAGAAVRALLRAEGPEVVVHRLEGVVRGIVVHARVGIDAELGVGAARLEERIEAREALALAHDRDVRAVVGLSGSAGLYPVPGAVARVRPFCLIQVSSKTILRSMGDRRRRHVRDDLEHRERRGPLVGDARNVLGGLDHAAVVLILGVAQALRQPLRAIAVGVDGAHRAAAARVDAVVAALDADVGLEQIDRPEAVRRDVGLELEVEDVVPLREIGFLVEAAVEHAQLLFDEAVELDATVERLERARGLRMHEHATRREQTRHRPPSQTAGHETSCTAAIVDGSRRVRVFPHESDDPERDRSRSSHDGTQKIWARVRGAASGTVLHALLYPRAKRESNGFPGNARRPAAASGRPTRESPPIWGMRADCETARTDAAGGARRLRRSASALLARASRASAGRASQRARACSRPLACARPSS